MANAPSRHRLVTRTMLSGDAGSSGRTCAAESASSARTANRLPAVTDRYRADCSARSMRHLLGGYTEGPEETSEHVVGCGRLVRAESTQIHVELAVGEAVGVVGDPARGERRLPHAAGSGDHGQCRSSPLFVLDQPVQRAQFPFPVGERRGHRKQLTRNDRLRPLLEEYVAMHGADLYRGSGDVPADPVLASFA